MEFECVQRISRKRRIIYRSFLSLSLFAVATITHTRNGDFTFWIKYCFDLFDATIVSAILFNVKRCVPQSASARTVITISLLLTNNNWRLFNFTLQNSKIRFHFHWTLKSCFTREYLTRDRWDNVLIVKRCQQSAAVLVRFHRLLHI